MVVNESLDEYQKKGLVEPISWLDFLEDLDTLVKKIHAGMDINRIVGMPRRGLIPAALLSLKLRTEVVMYGKNYLYIRGDLLVDDDCVCGRRMKMIKKKFSKLKTAVVYVSEQNRNEVDFFGKILKFKEADQKQRFILYPWMFHLLPVFPPSKDKLKSFGTDFDKILVGEVK